MLYASLVSGAVMIELDGIVQSIDGEPPAEVVEDVEVVEDLPAEYLAARREALFRGLGLTDGNE